MIDLGGEKRLFRPVSAIKQWINAILRCFCGQFCCLIQITNEYQCETDTRLCWDIIDTISGNSRAKKGPKGTKPGVKIE